MRKRILKIIQAFIFTSHFSYAGSEDVIVLSDTLIEKKALSNQERSFKKYWLTVRSLYSVKDQNFIDSWLLVNRDRALPQTKVIQLDEKKKAFRILVNDEGVTANLEFNTSRDYSVRINGTEIDNKNVREVKKLNGFLMQKSSLATLSLLDLSKGPLVIPTENFEKLSEKEKWTYFLHKRQLFELSQQILDKSAQASKGKYSWLLNFLVSRCEAAVEAQCVTLGGLVSTTEKGKCYEGNINIPKEFIKNSHCTTEQTLCHPLFYGLSSSGAALCAERGQSCSQISPLNSNKDMERIISSLKKVNIRQEQISKLMDEHINEATRVCQQSIESNKCDALLSRRAQFNSLLMDFDQNKRPPMAKNAQGPQGPGPKEKGPFEESRLDMSKDESCNWWCRNKSWASPVSIVAATLVTTVSICKFTKYNFLGICSKNKDNSTASSSSSSTSTIASPVAPTAADYTSVQ